MLRLISAVLHERQGSAVTSDARDLRPGRARRCSSRSSPACSPCPPGRRRSRTTASARPTRRRGSATSWSRSSDRSPTIATPTVDWYALTPILVLLGVTAVCLLVAVLLPASWKRPVAAVVTGRRLRGRVRHSRRSSSTTPRRPRASSPAPSSATGSATSRRSSSAAPGCSRRASPGGTACAATQPSTTACWRRSAPG